LSGGIAVAGDHVEDATRKDLSGKLGQLQRRAFAARSTSVAVESGACAITSPVAGLRTGSVSPSAESTNSPSM
jgi:hypothetical protein